MREKYCWLAGGWRLVLERCEKNTVCWLEEPNSEQSDSHRLPLEGLLHSSISDAPSESSSVLLGFQSGLLTLVK